MFRGIRTSESPHVAGSQQTSQPWGMTGSVAGSVVVTIEALSGR